ncbi:hypothetical protein DCAR_0102963 [Daucus carota subsp. sativus]|uniref:Uncharacterized protein n=1 Tax=Daucus carota subsp. sativus TaxID=79200 RepID=A0A166HF49_DAUCS|nr:PREDICTED: phytochrome A-associated F-box protein [Daucus carota subsp. sativus]WOG83785.1 hypothetical protein DCAR_0102963 [Daucus carota subsp. sativus]
MSENVFSKLSDDVILKIFINLEDDPKHWAVLACVCNKFSSLMRTVCWKSKCSERIPHVVSDFLAESRAGDAPPGGWAALHKLAVCCPGLLHSGVLLENSDFGLERELGPDENYKNSNLFQVGQAQISNTCSPAAVASDCGWSLYDDLYYDTVYDTSESQDIIVNNMDNSIDDKTNNLDINEESTEKDGLIVEAASDFTASKKRKFCRSLKPHLASGVWNLSKEQGNKLLASRFRGDCLYISDWPGCVHKEEKRSYMLFRGVFKNFKRSRVWRTINDGDRSKIDLNCEFCSCKQTWDLHSAFCLKRVFGYHDDGEPVVRAYVCENGHVSGAWTDWPLYT